MNNKPKTKRLTISLLCCGRPETTERCLKSIMPIREAVDSEIQVFDTGCTQETREIIEKYADEVFEFTWCNDFAKARNAQIDEANGQWFLYLDDDEYFIETQEFIDFFNNDECLTQDSGMYYQRNFLDEEGKTYSDILVSRATRMRPETQFKGKIHEYIVPAGEKTVVFNVHAGHFGYLFVSQEDNIKHSQRNISLLLDMIKEEPNEIRWPYQLAQEYRATEDDDTLLQLCQEQIENLKNRSDNESQFYLGCFCSGKAMVLQKKKDAVALKSFMEDAKNTYKVNETSLARIYYYLSAAYFDKADYPSCVEYAKKYFEYYERLKDDQFTNVRQGGIFNHDTFDLQCSNTLRMLLIAADIYNGSIDMLREHGQELRLGSEMTLQRGFVTALIKCGCKHGTMIELKETLDKVMERLPIKLYMLDEIRAIVPECTEEELYNLRESFRETSVEKEMMLFVELRMQEKAMVSEVGSTSYEEIKAKLLKYSTDTQEWYKCYVMSFESKIDENDMDACARLAVELNSFFEKMEDSPSEAINILKNAITIVPYMQAVLTAFTKKYATAVMIEEARKSDPAKFDEMYALEEAVLKQIEELETTGHGADASTTRGQLEGIIMQTYGIKSLHNK